MKKNKENYECKVSIVDLVGPEFVGLDLDDEVKIEEWFKHFTGWLENDSSLEKISSIKFITKVVSVILPIEKDIHVTSVTSLDDVSFRFQYDSDNILVSLVLNYDFNNTSKVIIVRNNRAVEVKFFPPKKKKILSKLVLEIDENPENKLFYIEAYKKIILREKSLKNEGEIEALNKAKDLLLELKRENQVQKIVEKQKLKLK